jgi:hypothetical protein
MSLLLAVVWVGCWLIKGKSMSAVGLFSQCHHVIHPCQLIMSFPTSSVTTINLMFCKWEADFATTLWIPVPFFVASWIYTSYVASILIYSLAHLFYTICYNFTYALGCTSTDQPCILWLYYSLVGFWRAYQDAKKPKALCHQARQGNFEAKSVVFCEQRSFFPSFSHNLGNMCRS